MGAGRKTRTVQVDTSQDPLDVRSIPPSFKEQQRKLGARLAGAVFGCTLETMQECVDGGVFGLPYNHIVYVATIRPGMPLFLFNYSRRQMHGVFVAESDGQLDINPHGWTGGREGARTAYPAQVRARLFKACAPLPEKVFKPAIAGCYRDNTHFMFELDRGQVKELCKLFGCEVPSKRALGDDCGERPLPAANKGLGGLSGEGKAKGLGKEATVENPAPGAGSMGSLEDFPTLGSSQALRKDGKKKAKAEAGKRRVHQLAPTNGGVQSSAGLPPTAWKPKQPSPATKEELTLKHDFPILTSKSGHHNDGTKGKSVGEAKDSSATSCLASSGGSLGKSAGRKPHAKAMQKHGKDGTKDAGVFVTRTLTRDKEWSAVAETPKPQVKIVKVAGCGGQAESVWAKQQPEAAESTSTSVPKLDESTCAKEGQGISNKAGCLLAGHVEKPPSEQYMSSASVKQSCKEDVSHLLSQPTNSGAHRLLGMFGASRDAAEVSTSVDGEGVSGQEDVKDALAPKTAVNDCGEFWSTQKVGSYNPVLMVKQTPREELYIIGGLDGTSHSDQIDVYDPSTKQWSQGPKLPMDDFIFGSAAAIGSSVFLFGGGAAHAVKDVAWCLDTRSRKWKKVSPLLQPRSSLGSTTIGGKIYAVGGGLPGKEMNSVEVYDPGSDRWYDGPFLNARRFGVGVTSADGVIYAAGGFDGERYLKSAEMWDPRQGYWSRMPDMTSVRGCLACTAAHGWVWAIAGFDAMAMTDTVEIYDPTGQRWHDMPKLSATRGYCTAEFLNNCVHAIGGRTCHEKWVLAPMQKYNCEESLWQEELPAGTTGVRGYHASCVVTLCS